MAPIQDKDSQKKHIGELLKTADRHIKNADWSKALEEVNKALGIEPNNMYALAYKDRINVSIAEEKKKQEEEKVKKLSEEKKSAEKPAETSKEEPVKDEKKSETPKSESKDTPKQEIKATPKDDSGARIESLRQEFAATQAKLQREVAQLTMQVKEAQALKETTEKNLYNQINALQQELAAAKQQAGKTNDKEIQELKKELENIKTKHQREVESAREIARAESLAQVASLQKELEAMKSAASGSSLKSHGESIIRSMLQKAWQDGIISPDERALLGELKNAVEMSDTKFNELESATKNDAYINALRKVWSDGLVTPEESDYLQALREKLGIPADEHFKLENQIRKDFKK